MHELRLLAGVANSMTREQAKAYISICDRFLFLSIVHAPEVEVSLLLDDE